MLNTLLAILAIGGGTMATQPPMGVAGAAPIEPGATARPDIPQIDAYEERRIAGFRVLVHRDLLRRRPSTADGSWRH